ncbi:MULTISPECIES: prephenate dehydratase [Aneurinibacillus]|jgi:prephenate dehydratase|uniref:Prephenate dehydratase n=1 Tax=Aneurinibacillus danicus TaxID=267746 RepID=A0A511V2F7_9BACL|nr:MULTISPECIES: prephenate dehydratase [Aneurinibacillus]GEN33059.1 prephenate dehydratase [Aneurinibacillus danicus]
MERTFAFLGPRGTNTEEAARLIFREEDDVFRPYRTIPDCLEAAADGKVNYAVVPWENSLEGSVNLTLDWIIHKINLPILSELIIPISHQLSCAKREHPLALSDVTKVLSHPQAIAQCHNYLRDYLPHAEIEYVSSTAEAARLVSEHPEEPWVAISAMQAVHSYPVMLLAENIEDTENNFTRFIVLGEKPLVLPDSEKHKTTILVTMPSDFPGALHQVLSAFAWRRINLSRIESRPTKTGLGNYHFVIDIEQKMDDVLLPGAFAEMEALGCQVRFLGTYPVFIKQRNGAELSLRS